MMVVSSAARKTEEHKDIMMIEVCIFVRDASGSAGLPPCSTAEVAPLSLTLLVESVPSAGTCKVMFAVFAGLLCFSSC